MDVREMLVELIRHVVVPYSCTRPLVLSFTYSLSIIILLSVAVSLASSV